MPSYWKNKLTPEQREPLTRQILDETFQMGDLELKALAAFSQRILMGQKKFGKLSPLKKHWGRELFEELVDASVYGMVRLIGDPTLHANSAQGQLGAYWDKAQPERPAKEGVATRQWGWSRKKGAGKKNAIAKAKLAKKGVPVPGADKIKDLVKAGTSDANVLKGKRKKPAKAVTAKKATKVAKKAKASTEAPSGRKPGRPKGSKNKPKTVTAQEVTQMAKTFNVTPGEMAETLEKLGAEITNPEMILATIPEVLNGSGKNKTRKTAKGVEAAPKQG